MSTLCISNELGPQFIVKNESEQLTLKVGINSSSLFQSTSSTTASDASEITAAEALGIYRAVTQQGFYCDSTIDDLSSYAGVTTVALVAGESGVVIRSGLIINNSWTWTPNASIFVSANGVLTQTAPSLPLRRIGWAMSATELNLDPYPIITGV